MNKMLFSLVLTGLCVASVRAQGPQPPATNLPPAAAVAYDLPEAGRVSLAVFDGEGRLVRTLLRAAPQKAGRHTASWDGLDSAGARLPAGEYRWKLLRTQGLTSEFLLNLGVSTGINHWPGQHGALVAVAREDDSLYVTAAMSEGSPQTVKIKTDGTYCWATPSLEGWGGGADLAVDGDRLYFQGTNPQGGHTTYVQDPASGRVVGKFQLARPVQKLGARMIAKAVSPTDALTDDDAHAERIVLNLANGAYRVRLELGDGERKPYRASLNCQGETKAQVDLEVEKDGKKTLEFPAEAKDGKLSLTFWLPRKDAGDEATFTMPVRSIEAVALPQRIAAAGGEVVVAFPQTIVWIDPKDGAVLDDAPLEAIRDIDIASPGTVLAIAGGKLVSLSRSAKTPVVRVADGWGSPLRLSVDRASGEVFVFDGAERFAAPTASEQVKRFDKDFKLIKTYGRAGGRRAGRYEAGDFLQVSDIAADGKGGFYVSEYGAAPRRLAHVDAEGNVLREWFGGQQFYTYAEVEPDNPDLVWMDSEWGWIMQVKMDYAGRSWKPVATYRWAAELDPAFFPHYKMTHGMHPMRQDLDGDGKKEPYLWSDSHFGLLLKVDESAGVLRPVAGLGVLDVGPYPFKPFDQLPLSWQDAARTFSPKIPTNQANRLLRGFAWADANGDYRMQADELRLMPSGGHGFGGSSSPCLFLDDALNLYQGRGYGGENQPAWARFPSQGRTPTGAPIWDWSNSVAGVTSPFNSTFAIRRTAAGELFTLSLGGGDGYVGQDTYGPGHGWQWPANQADRSVVAKYDPQGRALWRMDIKAARLDNRPGELHYPTRIAGLVNGCIGVCDKIVQPCEFWTEDGLYVGGLLDQRADDGLPERVYGWWRGDKAAGDRFDNLALFQYDMIVGGSLARLPDGSAVFFGAGWNSVPVFRITGWDRFARQEGALTLTAPTGAAARKGTGLTREVAGRDELDALLGPAALSTDAGAHGAMKTMMAEAAAAKTIPVNDRFWFEPLRPGRQWPVDIAGENEHSVTWTGFLEPLFGEEYTIGVYTTGKVTVFVGEERVIDSSESGFRKVFSAPLAFKAGTKVPLRITWSGDTKAGQLHLVWDSPSQAIEHIPVSALYPVMKEQAQP